MPLATVMAMPKTSMNENDGLPFGQHDVRLAGQILSMEPESITHPVKNAPDPDFWQGVLRDDTAHDLGPLLPAVDVGHRSTSAHDPHPNVEG
jgi:hypothetical protein